MGKHYFNMKFTSVAVAALLIANSSAVLLQKQAKDDCGGKWCNKGLAYDLDEATLRKAEADNAAKTQHKNGATVADNNAIGAHASSTQNASDTAAANAAAGEAKGLAAAGLAKATETYTDRAGYTGARGANKANSDANLKANQDRVAWEKDQLMKGQDQDALRF